MTGDAIPRVSGPTWDRRRNTSAVRPASPHAAAEAQRALAIFARDNPELAAWIAEGAPHLTHEQHVERFGVPYEAAAARRRRSTA